MIFHRSMIFTAVALSLFPSISSAEVRFNGFASIIGAMTLDSDNELYGYTDAMSFKPESRFAIQASANLSEGLSATAQLLSRGKNDFKTEFEWAYLRYELNDTNSILAGRIRIPFYSQSEFIDAGYAYNWLRVPQNVYNSDFNSWDGISFVNTHLIGGMDGQIQVQWGRLSNGELATASGSQIDIDFEGLALEYVLAFDAWQARLGYLKTTIDVKSQLDVFFNSAISNIETALSMNVPQGYIDNVLLHDDDLSFLSASLRYDNGKYFVGGEVIDAKYDDLTINPDQTANYVVAGIRTDAMTYHVTYGQTDNKARTHRELMNNVSASAMLDQVLSSVTNGFVSSGALAGEDSSFTSIGLNYYFHSNAVLKVDYTTYDNKTVPSNSTVDVISVGVDLVF